MNRLVRAEMPADVVTIHALTKAAFLEAPHTDHTEQFVVDALRKAGVLAISLVVEQDGVILGHVAVSPVSVSDGSANWYGLGPISVDPGVQGQGIGGLLMREAVSRLRELGAAGCVLLGDPSYYARFGFRPDPALVLPDVPPEYFQTLSFGPSSARGMVTYHAAFGAQS